MCRPDLSRRAGKGTDRNYQKQFVWNLSRWVSGYIAESKKLANLSGSAL